MKELPFKTSTARVRNHPLFTAYLALVCVCFFWGTTYIGFHVALDSFGPVTLVAVRNLISASLLLGFAWLKGLRFPRGRDLWITAGLGLMIIGVGNLGVALAEQFISTGLVSLFVTTSPFWYVGIDALLPGGERLHGPTVAGLLVGFAGVGMLVAPSLGEVFETGSIAAGGGILLAFLILQTTGASWTLGSVLHRNRQRNADAKLNPFVVAGIQQAATGIVFGLVSFLEPRRPVFDWHGMSGILYLSIFGGIVGYGSYMVALNRLPLAVVSTYTYVNPVVAVTLGWLIYDEQVGAREIGAMAVIFLGVALVRWATSGAQVSPPYPRSVPARPENEVSLPVQASSNESAQRSGQRHKDEHHHDQ